MEAAPKDKFVYVGTYTGPESKGIYLFRFQADGSPKGGLEPLGLAAEIANPSFLAIHPNRRFLYAVSEVADFSGQKSGSLAAFAIDPSTGKLTALNQVPSGGGGPCFVTVAGDGKHVLAANYGGGSVVAVEVEADGKFGKQTAFVQHTGSGPNPARQKGPHAHSVNLSPNGKYAIVADLGLDQLVMYRFDSRSGTLTAAEPYKTKPGAGPRHFAFHPNKKLAFVINEMDSTLTSLEYSARDGSFTDIETVSTLPEDFSGESTTAEVQVHPRGMAVYGSNRGHDSLAVFAVDKISGRMKLLQHVPTQGNTPRNFRLDPPGNVLIAANQKSNSLVVFQVAKDGQLQPADQKLDVPSPVCIKFL